MKVSNCCGVPPQDNSLELGICPKCKEWCEWEERYTLEELQDLVSSGKSLPENIHVLHSSVDTTLPVYGKGQGLKIKFPHALAPTKPVSRDKKLKRKEQRKARKIQRRRNRR